MLHECATASERRTAGACRLNGQPYSGWRFADEYTSNAWKSATPSDGGLDKTSHIISHVLDVRSLAAAAARLSKSAAEF